MSEMRVQDTGDPSAALQVEELAEGSGEQAARGRQAEVRYTCCLFDPREAGHKGRKLDGTDEHGVTFSFRIGAGQVNSALCTPANLPAGRDPLSYVFADPVYLTPFAHRSFGDYAYDRIRQRW